MPPKCSVCTHDRRRDIEQDLLAGASLRVVASQYHIGRSAADRHRRLHMPATLIKAKEAEEIADAGDLLAQMQRLHHRTLSILASAERRGEMRLALTAVREARGNLELVAKLYALLTTTTGPTTIRIIDETVPLRDASAAGDSLADV